MEHSFRWKGSFMRSQYIKLNIVLEKRDSCDLQIVWKYVSVITHFKIFEWWNGVSISYSNSLGVNRLRSFFESYPIFIKHFKCMSIVVCLFWALKMSLDHKLWVDVMENVILKRKVDIASHLAPFAFLIDLTKLLDSWYNFSDIYGLKVRKQPQKTDPFFFDEPMYYIVLFFYVLIK